MTEQIRQSHDRRLQPRREEERATHYAEQSLAAAACAWADARDTWEMVESADNLRRAVSTYRDALREEART
jgi:hypothetical protein